ncbi:response regulator [Halocola ammonii]
MNQISVGSHLENENDSRKINFIYLLDSDSIINYINRKLFQSIDSQLEVMESHNPKSALEFLKDNPGQTPDLILLDLDLPFMSGWEFIDACLDSGIETRFFLLSNEITSTEIQKAKTIPQIVGYTEKPLLSEGVEQIFARLN